MPVARNLQLLSREIPWIEQGIDNDKPSLTQTPHDLREGGLVIIDARLDPKDFPGQELQIPGDGHPTGIANRARALLVRDALAGLTR